MRERSRLMSGVAAVLVVVMLVAIAVMFAVSSRTQTPSPSAPPGNPVTVGSGPTGNVNPTTPPVTEPSPEPTPEVEVPPTGTPPEDPDGPPMSGLLSVLTPEEVDTATVFASQVAAALTTQVPDENRYARLKPLFTDESNGPGQDGPVGGDEAVGEPMTIGWYLWTDPDNETELATLVSIHFGRSIDGQYTEGDVTWDLRLVRDGTGWLASYVDLETVTG